MLASCFNVLATSAIIIAKLIHDTVKVHHSYFDALAISVMMLVSHTSRSKSV